MDKEVFGIVSFPVYRKEDDNNLYLARTEVRNYLLPYIFWGGPYFGPGSVIGNIKLGDPIIICPEEGVVITQSFAHGEKITLSAKLTVINFSIGVLYELHKGRVSSIIKII